MSRCNIIVLEDKTCHLKLPPQPIYMQQTAAQIFMCLIQTKQWLLFCFADKASTAEAKAKLKIDRESMTCF